MRKNIDIDDSLLTKLKVIAALEDMSVKSLMEKAVSFFIEYKEKERLNAMSTEEKEDLGLLLLMQQADTDDAVSRDKIMKSLEG
ncbi:hypothetical protein [Fulvivirga lutea]|uniref:Uncharacterized protein n=1 Tax=Fulvivirga lutea TaxID=2810512 RepID=A0A974ZZM1_9BACT|nr:hypothetical protein [Fulvivirga lutea]QSE96280.1 hypothetical protein JR347_11735 [Fulvivirga lutea]